MLPEDVSKVQEIITKAKLELKSVEVIKKITLEIDEGNLLVSDINELNKTRFRNESTQSDYLKELARENVQALINKVWDLPSETMNNTVYALLPQSRFRLPREKPIPKPKQPTKWELFAKEKGIKNKKKPGKEWDDVIKNWVPRYGYRKAAAEREKNWLIEVPQNADPYEDQFAKAAEGKKERIAKNEYLRLKNIAKAKNVTVPSLGVTAENMSGTSDIGVALEQTLHSTASLGKFQTPLKEDRPFTGRKKGQKRKLPSNDVSVDGIRRDKKRAMDVLGKMSKKDMDYETAVNKKIKELNVEMSHTGKKKSKSERRSKHGMNQGRKRYGRGPEDKKNRAALGDGLKYNDIAKKGAKGKQRKGPKGKGSRPMHRTNDGSKGKGAPSRKGKQVVNEGKKNMARKKRK